MTTSTKPRKRAKKNVLKSIGDFIVKIAPYIIPLIKKK